MKKYYNVNINNYEIDVNIDESLGEIEKIYFKRTSLNDTVYLIKLPENLTIYDNLPGRTIYVPTSLKIMYYISVDDNSLNVIHIYLSFNK